MKQDNPFAKLGALDQKLYQDTTPKLVKEDIRGEASLLPTGSPSSNIKKQGVSVKKPTSPRTATPEAVTLTLNMQEKPEKYTTHLEPSLVKRIKLVAVEKEIKDYEVVKEALVNYFKNN